MDIFLISHLRIFIIIVLFLFFLVFLLLFLLYLLNTGTQVDAVIMSAFLEFIYTDSVLGVEESMGNDLFKLAQKVKNK